MYTLRTQRVSTSDTYGCFSNHYICNLAATPELAASKAEAYFAAITDNMVADPSVKVVLDIDPEFVADKRNGKMSIDDTRKTEQIEAGIFPFGKHYATKISDAPDSYIMYFADMLLKKESKASTVPVTQALALACMGVALERGLIAKREAVVQARNERDALSLFMGEETQRIDFEGTLEVSIQKQDGYGGFYWINKVYCNTNIVIYLGSKSLGTVGEVVKFKATIKKHSLHNGIKTTQVSRPY